MKRAIVLLIFWWLLIFSSQGQWYNKYYGNKDLSELSQQDLSVLFQKSRYLKNIGKALTIGGIASVSVGSTALIVLSITDIISAMSTGNSASLLPYDIFLGSVLAGTVAIIGGIPVWIVGHTRNKEVGKLINHRISGTVIYFSPSFTFSNVQHKYYPALSISLRF